MFCNKYIGIELNGKTNIIIQKYKTIPFKKKICITMTNNSIDYKINIVEFENELSKNIKLFDYNITDIINIEKVKNNFKLYINFNINIDHILNLTFDITDNSNNKYTKNFERKLDCILNNNDASERIKLYINLDNMITEFKYTLSKDCPINKNIPQNIKEEIIPDIESFHTWLNNNKDASIDDLNYHKSILFKKIDPMLTHIKNLQQDLIKNISYNDIKNLPKL